MSRAIARLYGVYQFPRPVRAERALRGATAAPAANKFLLSSALCPEPDERSESWCGVAAYEIVEILRPLLEFLGLRFAQVVQLGSTDFRLLYQFDFRNHRRVQRKDFFDTDAFGDFSHGVGPVQSLSAGTADDDALEDLDALLVAFFDFLMHPNRCPGFDVREVGFQLRLLERCDDIHTNVKNYSVLIIHAATPTVKIQDIAAIPLATARQILLLFPQRL